MAPRPAPTGMFEFPTALLDQLIPVSSWRRVRRMVILGADTTRNLAARLLAKHPDVDFHILAATTADGRDFQSAVPEARRAHIIPCAPLSAASLPADIDGAILVPIAGSRTAVRPEHFPSDTALIDAILPRLSMGGWMVAVVSDSLLSSASLRSWRQRLLDEGSISSITALAAAGPSFFLRTGVRASVIKLMRRASRAHASCRVTTGEPEANLSMAGGGRVAPRKAQVVLDELRKRPIWSAEALLSKHDPEVTAYLRSAVPRVPLREVVEPLVLGISPFSRDPARTSKEATHRLINGADISTGRLDASRLQPIRIPDRAKWQRYETRAGDLLIMSRGNPIRSAVVPPSKDRLVPSHNIIRIRPRPGYSAHILKALLESPIGQKMLASRQRGGILTSIHPKDLADLPVPVPPKHDPERLARALERAEARVGEALRERDSAYRDAYRRLGIQADPE